MDALFLLRTDRLNEDIVGVYNVTVDDWKLEVYYYAK
jgi:hypothetical protein